MLAGVRHLCFGSETQVRLGKLSFAVWFEDGGTSKNRHGDTRDAVADVMSCGDLLKEEE